MRLSCSFGQLEGSGLASPAVNISYKDVERSCSTFSDPRMKILAKNPLLLRKLIAVIAGAMGLSSVEGTCADH